MPVIHYTEEEVQKVLEGFRHAAWAVLHRAQNADTTGKLGSGLYAGQKAVLDMSIKPTLYHNYLVGDED